MIKTFSIGFLGTLLFSILTLSSCGGQAEVPEEKVTDTTSTEVLADSLNSIDSFASDLGALAGFWQVMVEERGMWRRARGYYSEMTLRFDEEGYDGGGLGVSYMNGGWHQYLNSVEWENDSSATVQSHDEGDFIAIVHDSWNGDTVDVLELLAPSVLYDIIDGTVNEEIAGEYDFLLYRIYDSKRSDFAPSYLHENDKEYYDYEEGLEFGTCSWADPNYTDDMLTEEHMLEVLNDRNGREVTLHPETGKIEFLRMPNDKLLFFVSYQEGDSGGYDIYSITPRSLAVIDHITIKGQLPQPYKVVDDETIEVTLSKIEYSDDKSTQQFVEYTEQFFINRTGDLIKF